MIVWDIFRIRVPVLQTTPDTPPIGSAILGGGLVIGGRLFLLAFFTFHFGMFHFVHAAFLNGFFPVLPGRHNFPDLQLFVRVVSDYWPFVLVTALAERKAFSRAPAMVKGDALTQPYKN